MANITVIESHFDGLVSKLQTISENFFLMEKGGDTVEARLSDNIRHLNEATQFLYFIHRDTEENIDELDDLLGEAFRQATDKLVELRENRPVKNIRVVATLVNVALKMATERLLEIRTSVNNK